MFTQARQVHHEGVFKLAVHLLLDLVEVAVAGAFFELAAKQFFPVRAANNFVHPFAANQRARAGRREVIALWSTVQIPVIKREGFVVIINAGQGRVGKDFRQHAHAPAETRRQLAGDPAYPAALPLLLIFPVFRVANPRFGFNVVEPRIFHTFTPGPDVFTGDRAGVTANAFVEIQHHSNL